jgi:hypothetical protein
VPRPCFDALAAGGLGVTPARGTRAPTLLLPLPAPLLGEAAGTRLGCGLGGAVRGHRHRLRLGKARVQLRNDRFPGIVARVAGDHLDLGVAAGADQRVDQRLHKPPEGVHVVASHRLALALRRDLDGRVGRDEIHDLLAVHEGVDDLECLRGAGPLHLLVKVGVVEAPAPLVLPVPFGGLVRIESGAHLRAPFRALKAPS